jgi:hypothetical protein
VDAQGLACRRFRLRRLSPTVCVGLAMIAWIVPVATSSACAAASPTDEPAQPSCSSAEVAFTASRRFAIVGEPHGKRRHLYVNGDVIPNLKAEGQGFVVEQVLMDGVQLRDTRSRQVVRMGVGVVIPETNGRRLEGTVLLDGLEYCYLRGVAIPDPEPRLLQVRERRAQLVVEMAAPSDTASADLAVPTAVRASPSEVPLRLMQRLDETILEKVRVTPAGRDTYDLSAADVQVALEHGGRILMEAMATVRPMLSLDEGIAFRVRSPVADGVLGPRGFKVDNPNLAQRAGIEAGDVVMAVNGKPVTGFADLYHLYRQAKDDQGTSTISLDLQRDGQRVIKTYRIR